MTNPKENSSVERLTKLLKSIREAEIKEHSLLLDGEVSKQLINSGLIFKSQALEYVEVCAHCEKGKVIIGYEIPVKSNCPICQGRGITLKGDS